MQNTIAFLLAGGEGTRLGDISKSIPKPLVPFAGRYRLIDFPLSNAMQSGIKRLGVLVQANQKSIIDYLNRGELWGFRRPDTELLLLPSKSGWGYNGNYRGTADAVRQNLDLVHDDPDCENVLILSSDHIYNMDYNKLLDFHKRHNADVTVSVIDVPLRDSNKFGIIHRDTNNRIVEWEEKPRHSTSRLASMGIYVFSKEFLTEALRKGEGHDFGHHVIPFAIRNASIYAYKFDGYWQDVGTPDSYWQASMDILNPSNNIFLEEWQIETNRYYNINLKDNKNNHGYIVSPAVISNSIISDHCEIEGRVFNSILFPGVRVAKKAEIRNSIIMNDCIIAPNSRVGNAILCNNVTIGKNTIISSSKSYIQKFSRIDSDINGLIVIGENTSIKPGQWINKNAVSTKESESLRYPNTEQPERFPVSEDELISREMLRYGNPE
ncbi:MAG: sugar phosphate nucleotidyltransferase [Calditrichaceae bacterium]